MALDPSWIAVIGTAGGAAIGTVGTALVEWAKVATQGKQQRLVEADRRSHEAAEAKAARDAEALEKAAQREHLVRESEALRSQEAARELQAERRIMVDLWRTALGQASTDHKDRVHLREVNRNSSVAARRMVQIPDIVGTQWFESLRPYLAQDVYKTAETLECDTDTTVAISAEIAAIEDQWFGNR